MIRSILLTGATGFLGQPLLRRLAASSSYELHAISRKPADSSLPNQSGLTWHQSDLTTVESAWRLVERVRPAIIIHLAGEPDGRRDHQLLIPQFRSHAAPTVELLAAAVEFGVQRFIYCASMEEPSGIDSLPNSPYAASKLVGTIYAQTVHKLYSLPTVILKTFLTYGPSRQTSTKLIPYLIRTLQEGKEARLSSGDRLIDIIYLDDVVDAFVKALDSRAADARIIEIGSGTRVSIRQIATTVARIVGREELLVFDPAQNRPDERMPVADLSLGRQLLDWAPKTALQDGLSKTIDWYRSSL